MTSRISDASASSNLISIMMRAQERLYDANKQVVSGKVSQDYSGISRLSQRLVNLETSRDSNQRYIDNNVLAELRLTITDASIQGIEDAIRDTRLNITDFNGHGRFDETSIAQMQQMAFNNLKNIEAFLNTEVGGQFLFAGSVTDTVPVDLGLTTLGAFQQRFDGTINTYPETRDAHLATLSYSKDTSNDDSPNITSTNWLTFRTDDDLDATTAGTSSIEATGALFSNYDIGGQITISGTASNNGEYTIKNISTDGTKIFVETEMFTDEELPLGTVTQNGVASATFNLPDGTQLTNANTGNIDFDRDTGTITALTPASFDTVNVGDIIQIGGAGGSNGTFTVTANGEGRTAQVDTMTLAGSPLLNDTYSIDIDGNSLTYTVTGAEGGLAGIGTAMRIAINSDPALSAIITASDGAAGEILLSAKADGVAFTTTPSASNAGGGTPSNTSSTTSPITVTDVLTVTAGATVTLIDGTVIDANDTARMVFDRTGESITADRAAFTGLSAGDKITIAGTAENNGSYTIDSVSADGKSVTIKGSKLTDEGTTSGNNYFDYTVGTQYAFNTSTDTIQIQNLAGTAITGIFDDLQNGDSIVVTGTAKDGTYTIDSISADGSTITLDASTQLAPNAPVTEVDNDGATITVAARSLSFHTGDEIFIDAATDTISLRDISSPGTPTQNIFSNLQVGMKINLTGTASNAGPYTIATILSDGSGFTVSEDITTTETFNPPVDGSVTLEVYGAAGTISSDNSYYSGDKLVRQHRVDEDRTIDWDLTAIHPAFEKAIRALSILSQGKFGEEGGLDQNQERVNEALYLLNDALDKTTSGTPPYGTEIKQDLKEIEFDLGFKQVIINDTKTLLNHENVLLDNFIANIENADQLTAITRLVDEQRGLEASYQAMSRLLKLSLSDFL